jgi:hypothetical protein
MKTLLITLVFILGMITGCGNADKSPDLEDGGIRGGKNGGDKNGKFSDLNSNPLTENMINDNKSFSLPRGR